MVLLPQSVPQFAAGRAPHPWRGIAAPPGAGQGGFSLVEMMVAMAVGLLLLAGLTTIFIGNSRAHDEIAKANQQVENGRYAMELLADDLRNAGYYAEFDPDVLTAPTSLPDVCATAVTDLKTAMVLHVQGSDGGSAPSCISDVRPNTDVLVVRRVSPCAAGGSGCDPVTSGLPYFQASLCNGSSELGSTNVNDYYALDTTLTNLDRHQRDCSTQADLHRVETHIYFIANDDNAGDGIPTLKVAELGGGAFATSSLVQGIENMQLEYGLDTNGDGIPDVFTSDPNSYNGCSTLTTPTCVGYWQDVMAVKIHLIARNITPTLGLVDDKTYTLGLKSDGSTETVGPFNDDYKRHVYESSVKLYNAAGRRA